MSRQTGLGPTGIGSAALFVLMLIRVTRPAAGREF